MPVIEIEGLSYSYCPGTPYEKKALDGITLSVEQGELLAVIGANGSGKSTLVQIMNGLLQPTDGRVTVCEGETSDKEYQQSLWQKVGLVFQYPEQQLFEATVLDDVTYGMRNMGVKGEELAHRAQKALASVGLNPDRTAKLPPLALSGGQRRRVALAGVLAMDPEILIFDEPTAGLDESGRAQFFRMIQSLQREAGKTIIMVSHNMGETVALADKLAILSEGRLAAWGKVTDVIREQAEKGMLHFMLPGYLRVLYGLAEEGIRVDTAASSREEALHRIEELLREWGNKSMG